MHLSMYLFQHQLHVFNDALPILIDKALYCFFMQGIDVNYCFFLSKSMQCTVCNRLLHLILCSLGLVQRVMFLQIN